MGTVKVLPTFDDGVAIRIEDYDQCLVKDNLAALVSEWPKPLRVWGKEGITWPNIVAGGSAETEARVALATECLGHPLATVTLTVGHVGCS